MLRCRYNMHPKGIRLQSCRSKFRSNVGWTITVTALTSAFIIAGLAILIALAGEGVWSITAFLLHQYRTTREPQTGLFRQFQVILRNPNSSSLTTWEILKTGFTWRGKVKHARLKALALACWPLAIFVGFSAAGILVAKAIIPADDVNLVLLQSSNCGLWYSNDTIIQPQQTFRTYMELNKKLYADAAQSRAYASDCYNRKSQPLRCASLPTRDLPYTTRITQDCAWGIKASGGQTCNSSTLTLDTGLLDSHKTLGINARARDRVNFRLRTECVVLDLSDRVTVSPHPEYSNDFEMLRIWLGTRANDNYTFEYSTMDYANNRTYELDAVKHLAAPCSSANYLCLGDNWLPRPNLQFRDLFHDADVTIIQQASNAVAYQEKILDPFFYAGFQAMKGMWLSSQWVYHIGCTDQLQLCNPTTNKCSARTGAQKLSTEALNLNEKQKATAERIQKTRIFSTIYDAVYHHTAVPLLVDDMRSTMVSIPSPADQWTKEVERWFQTSLANMQLRIQDFPNNFWNENPSQPPRPVPAEDWPEATEAMIDLCGQQFVRPTEQYQSFSLAGITIVVVLSSAIVILSWILEGCLGRLSNRKPGGSKRHKLLSYSADGKLQLLRNCLEAVGVDRWQNKLGHVPYRYPPNPHDERDIMPWSNEEEIPLERMQPQSYDRAHEHARSGSYQALDPHQVGKAGAWMGTSESSAYSHRASSFRSEGVSLDDRLPLIRQQYVGRDGNSSLRW